MGIVFETFRDSQVMSMRAVFILSIFLGVFGSLVQTFDIDGLKRMESRSKVVEMRMDFDNMDLDDESIEDDEDDEIMSRRIHYLGDDDDFAEEDEFCPGWIIWTLISMVWIVLMMMALRLRSDKVIPLSSELENENNFYAENF